MARNRFERELAICQSELCRRLLPHIRGTLTQDSPGALAHKIVTDTRCAIAFGYRFNAATREKLVSGLDEPADGARLPAGRIFQSTILHRAIVYIDFVRVVFRILRHKECQQRADDVYVTLTKAAPNDYNIVDQVARMVEARLRNADEDADADAIIDRALKDTGRVYVDRELDAALWLLNRAADWRHGETLADDQVLEQVRGYVRKRIDEYMNAVKDANGVWSGRHISDPATLLWGLVVLLEQKSDLGNWANDILDRLARSKEHQRLDPVRNTDLETAPELFEHTWRSDAFALYDLATMRAMRTFQQTEPLISIWEKKFFDEPLPPRQNIHYIAQRLLAVETHLGGTQQHDVTPEMSFAAIVRHATEINIAEYRVMGDYLVWRDDPTKPEQLEKDVAILQRQIATYLDKGATRPMNILLWAPPGSGKSFFVKNVLRKPGLEKLHRAYVEVNAGQMATAADLPSALRRVTSSIAEHGAAAFFLDEADTAIPGADSLFPYLLMPMWDGQYLSDGHQLNMKRVVWFFAVSGKANDIDAFVEEASHKPKGEDFISRFHATISLPALSGRGQLLIFLGTLLRLHTKFDVLVEHELLASIATSKIVGGARAIEKAVMLAPVERKKALKLDDVRKLLRMQDDQQLEPVALDPGTEHEAVSIVDL